MDETVRFPVVTWWVFTCYCFSVHVFAYAHMFLFILSEFLVVMIGSCCIGDLTFWEITKEGVIYMFSGILLSHKKRWNTALSDNMHGPGEYHTKRSKSDRKS